MTEPLFSICIPNYNYAAYLPETIASVLEQGHRDLEVCVADNASTDGSDAVLAQVDDPRFRYTINRWNVGFAPNLDRASVMARGRFMILLSSDDLMRPRALETYAQLLTAALPEAEASRAVVTSAAAIVDAGGHQVGSVDRDARLWRDAIVNEALSAALGAVVRQVPTRDLLSRSIEAMRNPLPFLSTCYPRSAWEAVEGYSCTRLMNPDKHFAWKLLSVTRTAYFIEEPLFAYRWHASNQTAQQSNTGTLKHLVDQYMNTFDVPDAVLAHAGLERKELERFFVEEDIALRNLQKLARGDRTGARRGLDFGKAAYPDTVRRNWKAAGLSALLMLGPAGVAIARTAERTIGRHWRSKPEH